MESSPFLPLFFPAILTPCPTLPQVFVELGRLIEENRDKPATDPLALYRDDLHKEISHTSRTYYKTKGMHTLCEKGSDKYLLWAEGCLKSEEKRTSGGYLNSYSREELIKIVRDELLENHTLQLLDSPTGLHSMLLRSIDALRSKERAYEDLSRLFRLYRATPGALDAIACRFGDFIKKRGIEGVRNCQETKDSQLIDDLIKLHNHFSKMTKTVFKSATPIWDG